jgi:hypothetical protein
MVQMGLAESSLKLWLDAEKHLSKALDATTDDWVQHNTHPIEEQLAKVRAHLGWLVVTGTLNTEVFIDGTFVGKLPLSTSRIRRAEGPAEVQGRLTGELSILKKVEVLGGTDRAVRLEFATRPQILSAPVAFRAASAPVVPLIAVSPTVDSPDLRLYQALPWLNMGIGAFALVDFALLMDANHPCGDSSRCGPSAAMLIATSFAGGAGVVAGVEALILESTTNPDPSRLKAILIATSALAAAGAVTSGSLLIYQDGYGSKFKTGFGILSLPVGAATLILDSFAIFSPTPKRAEPRIAITPTPGGLALFGAF